MRRFTETNVHIFGEMRNFTGNTLLFSHNALQLPERLLIQIAVKCLLDLTFFLGAQMPR